MSFYLVLKALHIIAMVAWFAGLFYLPRLFVYHVSSENADSRAMLETMERRLYRAIMTPAMVATWLFGLALAAQNHAIFTDGVWMWLKLLTVIALTVFHISLGRYRLRLAGGTNTKSEKFFRIYNELPTLALIAVVLLVVLKPF